MKKSKYTPSQVALAQRIRTEVPELRGQRWATRAQALRWVAICEKVRVTSALAHPVIPAINAIREDMGRSGRKLSLITAMAIVNTVYLTKSLASTES